MSNIFGFPWEQDYQRAQRSKKGRNRILSYRNARRNGPRYRGHPKNEPGWYKEYLKSDHWREFRLRYSNSKQPQNCLVYGSINYELHHRTYERLWHEHLTDVVPLCRAHHAKTHALVKQGHDLLDAHKRLVT